MAPDGWQKWSTYVLEELKGLNKNYDELTKKVNEELTELKIEVAMLKVKSGIWGSIGAIIVISVFYLSRYIGG